jgi:antirestriction protein
MANDTPKIYAACLAAYNNGILHGAWIDATDCVETMQEEVNAMLAASPVPDAEEWAIHDHEGLADLGEYAGLAEVAARAVIIEAAMGWDIPGVVLIEAMHEHGAEDAEGFLSDHYAGRADDWADFAEQYTRETQDMAAIPDWVQNHIDWESVARDFKCGGDFNSIRAVGEVFFFYNR